VRGVAAIDRNPAGCVFLITLCMDMKTTQFARAERANTSAVLYASRIGLVSALLATALTIAGCGGGGGGTGSTSTSAAASGNSSDGQPTTTASNLKLDCAPAP
jgi:hypothetical protein